MKQCKKILIVSPWSITKGSVGGTERFIVDLASGLAKKGHRVDILMMSGKDHTTNLVHYHSINIFGEGVEANEYIYRDLFNNSLNDAKLASFCQKIGIMFDTSSYDVVLLNSLLFLYLKTNSRRIFVIHTNPFELKLDWGRTAVSNITHMIKKDSLETDIFVTPSQYYALYYGKIFDKKIYTIPHSVDLDRLQTKLSKHKIATKYGIGNKYIFLVPSRLDFKQKRPQIALKAITSIGDKLPGFEIVFTGLDSHYIKYANTLTKKAKKLNINVHVVRFENISEAYKIADMVILPSQSESFGYSALEAIALKKKVILNNIPTFQEIQKNSTNTFTFDQTSNSLAGTIIKALNTHDFIKNDWEEWIKRYSKDTWIDSFENIFDRM